VDTHPCVCHPGIDAAFTVQRGEEGVMEARNYYLALLHWKVGKWNLPLDEGLFKKTKKSVHGK
jgi:hypothetical protein